MKSKAGQYIVRCIHLVINVLLRSIVIKQFTDEWNMAFP